MTITNKQSGTNVHEIADGIYRISTPVKIPGAGGFSFNQYLIVDDNPIALSRGNEEDVSPDSRSGGKHFAC